MKFSANKTTLLEALTVTGKAIGTSVLPILGRYLFKINNDKIQVTGGSMDIFIHKTIEIEPCGLNAAIAIPKNKIFDLINDSPNQKISFEVLENIEINEGIALTRLKVTTMMGEYLIPIDMGNDYPTMVIEGEEKFTLAKDHLLKIIDWTTFACSDDALRPELTGVFMGFNGNKINCASTNGFMVTDRSFVLDSNLPDKDGIIIPKKALSLIASLPLDEPVEIMAAKSNISFKLADDVLVESVLVDGKYPDYASVIPADLPNSINIRKSQLLGSVKRVVRFSELGSAQLVIEVSHNNMRVSTANSLGEKADENLTIDYSSDLGIKIGISGKLLMNSLAKIATNDVSVSFNQPNNPIILREIDDNLQLNTKENMIMIMPMILNN